MAVYKNLPILFTRQFKNSLNPTQRNMFNKLRVLSLIRCKVLKDVNKPISVDNINFGIFHTELNFDDFKIKQFSKIQDLIKEISQNKIKNKTPKKEPFKKYMALTSAKRKSTRNSFTDRKEDNSQDKAFYKNYFEQKKLQKKLFFDDDSFEYEEENEDDLIVDDEDTEFKYEDEYDINKLRKLVIKQINNDKNYPNYEKDILIDITNSGVFIELMNSLELSEIIELEQDLETIIDFIRFYEKLKLKENEESFIFDSNDKNKNKLKNDENNIISSSSSNSIEINIDEKKIIYNDIRRTFMLNRPKFHLEPQHFEHSRKHLPSLIEESNTVDKLENEDEKKINKKFSKSKTIIIKNNDEVNADGDDDDLDLKEIKSNKSDQ